MRQVCPDVCIFEGILRSTMKHNSKNPIFQDYFMGKNRYLYSQ